MADQGVVTKPKQSQSEYGKFESALRKILTVPKDEVKKADKAKPKKPKKEGDS